jgi:predicted Zn-dependent protease
MISRDEAKQIVEKIVSYSKADETSVSLAGGVTTHLRFARNNPSTSGSFTNTSLTVRATFGKRSGGVSINQFDEASLQTAVSRAEELAKLSPEDPERMPLLGPQNYAAVNAFSPVTEREAKERVSAGVAACLEDAQRQGVTAAGFVEVSAGFQCLANSKGLFGYHPSTSAHFSQTSRTQDSTGSGWSSTASHRVEDLDFLACAKDATAKALRSRNAKPLDPGMYTTILEPNCVASMVQLMFSSMDKRSAAEGRSYFSSLENNDGVGTELFSPLVSLYSDPADALTPGLPWGNDGLPQTKKAWLQNGELTAFPCDRFWAQKNNLSPIPNPSNFIWSNGTASLDDLIASTERGLLVTSLWYIRGVDPRTLLFTGLTRDGLFLIEKGKIVSPVQNFRWNDSPINLFKGVESISKASRVPPRESKGNQFVVPAIKVKAMNFTSVSDAV